MINVWLSVEKIKMSGFKALYNCEGIVAPELSKYFFTDT